MSLDLLRRLREVHAFDASPLRHDLGIYHVPFDELAPGQSPEARLAGAARRGERIAVVGRSGSGKSSLIEHVLGPVASGIAPIPVRVFGEPAHIVTSVQAVAGLIIQTLVDHANLDNTERARALEAASSRRVVSSTGRGGGLTLGGAWMGAELRVDVQRQASNTELPRTAQATLEVVNQLLTAIQGDNLMPVLVFDDTDRWFRKAGGTMDHHDLALTFFGTVLPELRQLPTSIVIAAHSDYLNNTDLANHLRATIESRINIPELPSTGALGKVIHSRVIAHTSPDAPTTAAPLNEVIDTTALNHLYQLYQNTFAGALRDVIRTVHVAVTDACNSRFETVTPELVDQAAAW